MITWTPFEGGTFDVKCTATNGNGTVTETSQMTIITEAEGKTKCEDPRDFFIFELIDDNFDLKIITAKCKYTKSSRQI